MFRQPKKAHCLGIVLTLLGGLALAGEARPERTAAASQLTLTSSPNPSGLSQPFTLTASVKSASGSGPIPTGTVSFISNLCEQPCAAPVGVIGTSLLDGQGRGSLALGGYSTPGSIGFAASYSGDANYGGGFGNPLTQVVSASVGIPAVQPRNLILLGLLPAGSGFLQLRNHNA